MINPHCLRQTGQIRRKKSYNIHEADHDRSCQCELMEVCRPDVAKKETAKEGQRAVIFGYCEASSNSVCVCNKMY